jgi:tetratricopeptide (TPR) repeat protein
MAQKKIKEINKKIPNDTGGKKPVPKWFYLIMLLIPVLFFILLEIFLRVINYGKDYTQFDVVSEYYPDKLFLNPDLPFKYFTNVQNAPGVVPDGFDINKKENAFRIFVLGGSSAAGWPYMPNAAFSRQLKRRLELLYPDNTIEVINCGISAINTYTIRDLIPEILKQKPDLILIYAGHNEYYGALGVASSVSMGRSRWLINSYIMLKQFKTTQLIQNFLSWGYGLFGSSEKLKESGNETLMSQMIGESLIAYDSDLFKNGIEQFEENMHDILSMIKDENIPVILSSLTSNLKDQKPFISVETENYPLAENVYNEAQRALNEGNIEKAKTLFKEAKELDALRFRAPKKINEIILKFSKEFNYPFVDIDSVFIDKSTDGIVGENLMVDHLHPNIDGYDLMAKAFYQKMDETNNLPKEKKLNLNFEKQDSILSAEFPFTRLDSVISEMRIIILTGAYPFVPKGTPNYKMRNRRLNDFIDSTAMKVINKEIIWEKGHVDAAEWYYNKGMYEEFVKEMNAIIEERPYNDTPYEHAINLLIEAKRFEDALPILIKYHKYFPSAYTTKWMGQIYLQGGEYKKAIENLEKSVEYNNSDYQVWYNLGGAYYYNNHLDKALTAMEKSLSINPQNPPARNFYEQLKRIKY